MLGSKTFNTWIGYTRWFKYDRDDLCVNKSQFVPIIFEPPCIIHLSLSLVLDSVTYSHDFVDECIEPRRVLKLRNESRYNKNRKQFFTHVF
jgi:hypothetical protein